MHLHREIYPTFYFEYDINMPLVHKERHLTIAIERGFSCSDSLHYILDYAPANRKYPLSPHFSYLEDSKDGYVVKEIKAPKQTNRINDFIEQEVIDAAMELMKYNLELQVEIEEKCPFAQWKRDLKILNDSK